jgi:hypothetical protein
VYVRDRVAASTVLVSVDSSGNPANDLSVGTFISRDGRFVSFSSDATNLVPGGVTTYGLRHGYLHDRDYDQNGVFDELGGLLTECIDVDTGGQPGNGTGGGGSITPDGRYVCFSSFASNLLAPGMDTNGVRDVFVRDRATGTTVRVSVDSSGTQASGGGSRGGWLSDDGRYVGYYSDAPNLVANDQNGTTDTFVHDRDADANGVYDEPGGVATYCVSRVFDTATGNNTGTPAGSVEGAVLSADGRFVAFNSASSDLIAPGLDTNGVADMFVYDRSTCRVTRVSVDSYGGQGNGESSWGTLSADGRFVAFYSYASNLVAGDTNGVTRDVFRHDRDADADGVFDEPGAISTICVSVNALGVPGNAASEGSSELSADGRCVGFYSYATDLVAGDSNGSADAFVWSDCPGCGAVVTYCTAKTNSLGCVPAIGWSGDPSATSPAPCDITATNIVDNKAGIFFYGTNGRAAVTGQCPWNFGGVLCVQPPLSRTPVQNSGGVSWSCGGTFSIDFNAVIQSGINQNLVPGAQVNGEYWYRDPQAPCTTGTTDAIEFTICPR